MQSCSGITQTTTTLNIFQSYTFSLGNMSIFATNNNRAISIRAANPVPATGG